MACAGFGCGLTTEITEEAQSSRRRVDIGWNPEVFTQPSLVIRRAEGGSDRTNLTLATQYATLPLKLFVGRIPESVFFVQETNKCIDADLAEWATASRAVHRSLSTNHRLPSGTIAFSASSLVTRSLGHNANSLPTEQPVVYSGGLRFPRVSRVRRESVPATTARLRYFVHGPDFTTFRVEWRLDLV